MTSPHRALIVIDAQQEYFDGVLEIRHPSREDSLKQILAAIDVADREGLPIVIVQHEFPDGAPVFAAGSAGWKLHPDLEARIDPTWKLVRKNFSSTFAGTGVAEWLADNAVDTVTLVGYMTNNCVLATAAAAEPLGLAVELLSDATGAIALSNEAGTASAQQVHETIMTLLQSNWAAVAPTDTWVSAVSDGRLLPKSDLGTSALQGARATA